MTSIILIISSRRHLYVLGFQRYHCTLSDLLNVASLGGLIIANDYKMIIISITVQCATFYVMMFVLQYYERVICTCITNPISVL